jgi:phosphoglycolate phosphatase-like HAD superfamily hydrolase
MLDRDLLRLLLVPVLGAGGSFEHLLPALIDEAQQHYLANCPNDLKECVCPGVSSFLDLLKREGIPCFIVSGNLSSIGWKKLELAGLHHYFAGGAFAEEGLTRATLVARVLRLQPKSARESHLVSLIGDHINDIRAARKNGVRSIAVATGVTTADELWAERPDYLFGDLREARLEHVT